MGAVDSLDEFRRAPLDRVRAGLAERLAGFDVARERLARGGREADRRARQRGRHQLARRVDHRERRQHVVRAAGEAREHRERVGGVGGLAEDRAVDRHRRVGDEHGRGRQAARDEPRARGLRLRDAHAQHVMVGRLARQLGLERFGILIGRGREQFVAHAELIEQFAAPGALRGEVDERVGRGGVLGHLIGSLDGRVRGASGRRTATRDGRGDSA